MRVDKSKIVHAIEACLPNIVVRIYRDKKFKICTFIRKKRHAEIVNRLRKKKTPINVIFMAISGSTWKYEYLYKLMLADSAFKPIVLVCPQVNFDDAFMRDQMDKTLDFFKCRGYNVISSFDKKRNIFINLEELHPDILMYTNPYKGIFLPQYFIDSQKYTLPCYISYYYPTGISSYHDKLKVFESALWINFMASTAEYQRAIYKTNCVVVGYPMFEAFKNGSCYGKDWKNQEKKFKRIIWAPYHHIFPDDDKIIQCSTFLKYADIMLTIAHEYQDKVQFVLKPHPLLRAKLEKHPEWGKARTDAYFELWKAGQNTNLVEGEYIDLFNSSDALIHDCGSFIVEYLYVNKPVLYLASSSKYGKNIGSTGIEALMCHEIGFSENDITNFVRNIYCESNDSKLEARKNFYRKNLLPPNGLTASENMLNEIKNKLHI